MIERYFKLGVRFKWSVPLDAKGSEDGSIIANPLLVANPMVYDGLDGELYSDGPRRSPAGLGKGSRIPYTWLCYAPGRTTTLPSASGDILTGKMTGCLIPLWNEGGRRFVGHVGTEVRTHVNKKVKETFDKHMPQTTTAFDPANAWPLGEVLGIMKVFKRQPGFYIMALVTSTDQFYSVLMFDFRRYEPFAWCCGGTKQVQSMNYQAIHKKLTS